MHVLTCREVRVEGKGVGLLSAVCASELLRHNREVASISLRGNHLDTEAAALFATGLAAKEGMECLETLDLSYNLIRLNDLQWAARFFRAVASMPTLRHLRLDSNEMKDDALWGVASYVAVNPPLRSLSLRDQDFTRRKALGNLIQNLRFNNKLVSLDLRYNPAVLNEYIFSAESLGEVAHELEQTNPGLRVLPFHEDPAEVVRAPRRRLPGRPDLYPTLKTFTHDDMHRQRQDRVSRFEERMANKGQLHVRTAGEVIIM